MNQPAKVIHQGVPPKVVKRAWNIDVLGLDGRGMANTKALGAQRAQDGGLKSKGLMMVCACPKIAFENDAESKNNEWWLGCTT